MNLDDEDCDIPIDYIEYVDETEDLLIQSIEQERKENIYKPQEDNIADIDEEQLELNLLTNEDTDKLEQLEKQQNENDINLEEESHFKDKEDDFDDLDTSIHTPSSKK